MKLFRSDLHHATQPGLRRGVGGVRRRDVGRRRRNRVLRSRRLPPTHPVLVQVEAKKCRDGRQRDESCANASVDPSGGRRPGLMHDAWFICRLAALGLLASCAARGSEHVAASAGAGRRCTACVPLQVPRRIEFQTIANMQKKSASHLSRYSLASARACHVCFTYATNDNQPTPADAGPGVYFLSASRPPSVASSSARYLHGAPRRTRDPHALRPPPRRADGRHSASGRSATRG